MKVLKFGGSSVKDHKNIQKVLQIIAKKAQEDKLAVVVSAFGKTTDNLLKTAELAQLKKDDYLNILNKVEKHHYETIEHLTLQNNSEVIEHVNKQFNQLKTLYKGCYLLEELSPKAKALISSFGERLSSYIISEAAKAKLNATFKNSQDLIITNDNYLKAQVDFETTFSNCSSFFGDNSYQVVVLPGFIAKCYDGQTTTLGRGGSDYTASIFAAAIHADELQIWTDVSGMYTANPSIVKQAKPIQHISYEEAMEMSHFGAKVIYPPTIQPVREMKIPVVIKNTFEPDKEGTLITQLSEKNLPVKGITHVENISLLTLEGSGMVGMSGVSNRLFESLSDDNVNVILITQASSEHTICVGVLEEDAEKAVRSISKKFENEINQHKIDPVIVENDLSIIAIVGDNMKNHQGLSGKMFSALGKNNVNIRAIAQGASEKNISAVTKRKDAKKALNTLHEQFFGNNIKQLNLFVTGVGNVGNRFLAQLQQQQDYLQSNLKINIRLIGLSNSSKMYFDEDGINLSNWKNLLLKEGESTSLESFLKRSKKFNMRNSIFIDNTANEEVARMYQHYLESNIAVVTCNKIACASELHNYKTLKKVSKKFNAPFLFETNVGAGLPIIDTLKNLIASGDRVHKIQAVLSGSLNFVFNNFGSSVTFHDIVKQAQEEGYTEPDPKIDLSGVDVARKILILARESGYELELSDIDNNSFLPKESLSTSTNNDFYASLTEFESHFQEIYAKANSENCKLKYVAEFENGKAKVGLQHIPSNHPFYNLEGSDNIVLFFTDRYPVQPLQIKGAGAGADVTASGIFADVIRVANN
ncbi:bifunctional aspartate kinase/homoserine dehydrogenase I [Tenacibaculum sp. SZ-18]|uniref:bifunctional aspartate kinase/homoserine dehydrogenase I n=1 Tax=Tenacibaculum sp. SZ-18 TaxID=754423 RepID=UPI000C2D2D23|nr:bifunctional aspartate kinase/homoserine dehydrogenase I [Tenacibaculum sp. SZ-18]AUC15173.1 bifunctional aspartate kinase/homoserine dehydrogenase I [Tenacibaculum sp. SZ-18]